MFNIESKKYSQLIHLLKKSLNYNLHFFLIDIQLLSLKYKL